MSTLKIQEQLELDAGPDRVWEYLVDPERIVACLPGASIESSEGEGIYRGSLKVKVGPATMTYQGVAEFLERDSSSRCMRLEAKARDKSGGGQVRMSMESTVEALADGRSRLVVDVELKLAGKIVRFGRGMIGVVSERLFQDFAACLADRLATGEGEARNDRPPDEPEPLGAVHLLFRAFWSRLRRFFGAGR